MIKKATYPDFTAKKLKKMVDKGTMTFDNAIQRGLVWKNDRKSLLIHSMIVGYPIPPFYAEKNENGNMDMLDGKQRSNTIREFLDGEFALVDLPETENESSELIDLNGKKFSDLPQEFQDNITDYSLTLYFF